MGKVQVETDIPQVVNYVATTVNVGTTTTLSSGSNATVTNVGTESNAILDFGIPKGKDAYETAVAGGYTGTEQEFNAALASDITTVANNISDINTVGADITNVNTVAGNTTNIDKVAAIDSDVTTVAGISSDVTNVASIKNAVVAVNANESKINTVYDNLANVNTVAGNITNVNTVSGVSSDVTNVAGISTAVSTVSTNVASVSTVATNISNVNAVAANESNINAVNANKTNIDTVAGISSDVTTVAGSSTAVSTVSSNISDVNTAATNISAIIAAPTQASNAAASATNAQKWAEGADADVTPLGGTHSAKGWAETAASTLSGKQDTLVSGTNIKTVNNNSLLGSGNINIDSLPSQTGNNGKFLTTDGSAASWATIPDTLSADGTTIENNSNVLTTVGVKEQNASAVIKKWVGTKAQYDAIVTKDSNTEYTTTDEIEWQPIVIDNALSSSSENPVQNKVIKAALDAKQATITGAVSNITSSNLTASKALASDASGKVVASSVTATELGYVSGVTSAIQTQLNAKQPTLPAGTTGYYLQKTADGVTWAAVSGGSSVTVDGTTIDDTNDILSTIAVKETRNSAAIKQWVGTTAQYSAINDKDANTLYIITDSPVAQTVSNLVTSVSSSSTDAQYPSAKLFYDTCGDIETLINAL